MRDPFFIPAISRLAWPALLFGCASLIPAQEYQHVSARCSENLCLVYLLPQADSDGDGVSDTDEKAAGSDPYDAKSHPPIRTLADLIGQGRLQSFNRGLIEVVVLPTVGPNGRELVSNSVRELKPATLAALGISEKTLSRFGITADGGFTLSSALPQISEGDKDHSAGNAPPPRKIGGIQIALYSADENGVDMGPGICMGCKNPDSETVKTDKSWWEAVKEFFGAGKGDGGTPDKPDGGTMTDPDAVPVVPISEEDYQRVWFKAKGGTVSHTYGGDLPTPLDEEPPVLGRNPNGPIILVNPDESDEHFGSMRKIIVIKDPSPRHSQDENTRFGPTILGGIQPGTAVPKE